MDTVEVGNATDGLNLPYNSEAEQAVLGAILMDTEALAIAMEILPSGDYFYLATHKEIYNTMIELFTLSKPVDIVTVLNSLSGKRDISDGDTKAYLLNLADFCPSIKRVRDYANIVKDKYMLRSLIVSSREIIDDASSAGDEIAKVIDSAEQRIFEIRDSRSKGGLRPINEVILETFVRLDLLNSEQSEQYKGIPTGIGLLDNVITGLNRSDLILLAARPGMGKTSFALNIAKHVAMKCRRKVAFFSLEMTKEQLASRLLSMEALISGTTLRTGKLSADEWIRLIEAGDVLGKTELYLDDTPGINVPEIKAKLRRLKGIDLLIIDYLQLMSASRRIDNRVQEISEITRNLKILAKELDVPVITLSQLSRASEQRAEHKPQLSDLRDSGSIEQDADIVLFLYREDYYKNTEGADENTDKNSGECIVAKNRHGETRSVPLHWQGEFMRFTAVTTDNGQ
ncbi:MAG: replicative DNA helicase [Clostridia bacterium]|nr:replicative DNA helicase [Clostridia bacterium]